MLEHRSRGAWRGCVHPDKLFRNKLCNSKYIFNRAFEINGPGTGVYRYKTLDERC